MVDHVVVFQVQPELAFQVEMMHGIVRHIIKKVSYEKPGEKGSHQCRTQQEPEQKIEQRSQWNADGGHHDQPLAVAGIIVVNAMKDEMDAPADFPGKFQVKDETMQHVFGEGPGA